MIGNSWQSPTTRFQSEPEYRRYRSWRAKWGMAAKRKRRNLLLCFKKRHQNWEDDSAITERIERLLQVLSAKLLSSNMEGRPECFSTLKTRRPRFGRATYGQQEEIGSGGSGRYRTKVRSL